MPRTTDRLPFPYRPEAETLAQRLAALQGALDWAAAAQVAAPWVRAVRENPPPFWAMESLLKEYPISSAEGLALMRLAEALLRVPDAETAIALTADQLGRADFDGAADSTLARLSSTAIAMSKHFLPESGHEPGLMAKLGARTVVAATLACGAAAGPPVRAGPDDWRRHEGGDGRAQEAGESAGSAAGPPQGGTCPLGGQRPAQRRSVGALVQLRHAG